MAAKEEVKLYLAYWFQLGKRVMLRNGQEALLPKPIFLGNHYSLEFEACWRRILDPESGECYLEGTTQTITQLLSGTWEIVPCARCQMPVALSYIGHLCAECPCADLNSWPNLEIPQPRSPVDNHKHLSNICQRLQNREISMIARKFQPNEHCDDEESHKSENHKLT